MPKRGIELEHCVHENDALTARPQLEILVTFFFSGLEKAVCWIKKKIFQETDFYDNKKMSQINYSDFFLYLCPRGFYREIL